MFTKKYKLTQEQIDEINEAYNALKEENAQLKAENLSLKEKLNDSFIFDKAKELKEENETLRGELGKAKQSLKIANSTMSAVLEKLNETNIKLLAYTDCELKSVTRYELNILS